jgi:hypothetical protein
MEEYDKAATYDDYNRLIQLGGRPSAEIQPGLCERTRCYLELCRWEKFREYQQLPRKNPETFVKYVDDITRYRQKKGIGESLQPQLQLQPEQQTKLDEWKEYYIYEHCKLGRLERERSSEPS